MRKLALWSALCLLGAVQARAGTYSFSFAPTYCDILIPQPGVARGVTGGAEPKPAILFPAGVSVGAIGCIVTFPYQAGTNKVSVDLTWQVDDTIANGKSVQWSTSYVVSKANQDWQSNSGIGVATTQRLTVQPGAIANTDQHAVFSAENGKQLTAVDMANVACDVNSVPPTCAGLHGYLYVEYDAPASLEETATVYLTNVNVTVETP